MTIADGGTTAPRGAAAEQPDEALLAELWGRDRDARAERERCRRALSACGGVERLGRLALPELVAALREGDRLAGEVAAGVAESPPPDLASPRVAARPVDRTGPPGARGPAVAPDPVDLARRLLAAVELGRRAMRAPLPLGEPVREAADLEPHLRGRLAGLRKEVFLVVLLDAKNRPFRVERVSEGCLTWSVVHPREVFAPAVREGAGAIVVAHNHPSGDPEPSRQDLEVTERLHRVGVMLGIPLLDHVVVGADRCVSLRARCRLSG